MRRKRLGKPALLGLLALPLALLLGPAAPAGADGGDLPPELEALYPDLTGGQISDLARLRAAENGADVPAPELEQLHPELQELYPGLSDDDISTLARARAVENEAEYGAEHYCIPAFVEGGSMQDCWEAPNPLLPETNEIIWGAVGFAVVFLALAKFAFPAMKKGMEARTERIRQDLQSAEDKRTEADELLTQYQAQLADARSEASRIIEEARQTADQVKRDRETELQAELAELRERAQSDIAASKAQATDDLRGDLAQLAIGAAEAVVRRSLDTKAHKQLVEDYIDRVAAGSQT